MAKQTINVGSSANDGTGDKNRVAFQKTNANFTELYDTKVESVTGSAVDNTDPLNPVINSSGGVGTLQEVTDLGNITDKDINVNRLGLYDNVNANYGIVQLSDNVFDFFNSALEPVFTVTSDGGIGFYNIATGYISGIIGSSNTADRSYDLPDQSGTIALLSDITGGATNLSYTPSPTDGKVNSDTGTDATLPLADATNAGLLSPSEKTAIATIPNVNTNAVDRITVKLTEGITKGQAVYISGANGTNILVSKASNTSEATSSKTLGLLETTGATNAIVNVVTSGLLDGINTSSATIGDPVWLGVSGNLIFGLASKPYAPAHLVYIGVVSRVSATVGEIIVKVQNGFELREIHDVDLISNSPTNNQALIYESSTSLWKNKTIIEDSITDGTTDKAPSQNSVFDALALKLTKSGDTITGDIGNTSTGYFRLPNGTTAQRPASPANGMRRYNTDTLRDEFYANGSWQNHARLSGDTFTGNIFASNLSGTNTGDGYNYKNTTSSSTLTGTLTETQMIQVTIPANTFSSIDFVKFISLFVKTGTAGIVTLRAKISTSATMPTGTTSQIAMWTSTAANVLNPFSRNTLCIKSGNLTGFSFIAAQNNDGASNSNAVSSVAFDTTVTQYFYISATLASIADSVYMNSLQISNI